MDLSSALKTFKLVPSLVLSCSFHPACFGNMKVHLELFGGRKLQLTHLDIDQICEFSLSSLSLFEGCLSSITGCSISPLQPQHWKASQKCQCREIHLVDRRRHIMAVAIAWGLHLSGSKFSLRPQNIRSVKEIDPEEFPLDTRKACSSGLLCRLHLKLEAQNGCGTRPAKNPNTKDPNTKTLDGKCGDLICPSHE